MTSHDTLPATDEKPNFLARRAAVGAAALLVTLGGIKAYEIGVDATQGIKRELTKSDLESHACTLDRQVVIGPSETVWGAAGIPLAKELGIPIDHAMNLIREANPPANLGVVTPGTKIVYPDCKK